MKKIKEINGVEFKIVCPKERISHLGIASHFKCYDLDDCYDRPSDLKKAIFKGWKMWSCDVEGLHYFGIQIYNCMMFTLSGLYYDMNEDKYYILTITKTRHELMELA